MIYSADTLWPAPAKLNLFLHITGQREDGYHLLQTVFQFVDLADQLRFKLNDQGLIRAAHQYAGISEEEDLTLRAARLLQEKTATDYGVEIELIKNLPVGGGIGGGSSDAATVLLVLNNLWRTGLDFQALADLGLQLGADVPVFIHGHACWAEGVGEKFQPIDLPEPTYLLIYPKVHVSTEEIFGSQELTRETPPITIAAFLAGRARNDCEPVVRNQVLQVDEAMKWLDRYAPARLTGTGACIFAEFETTEDAKKVANECPEDWQSFVTQGYNRSPLHQLLDEVQ